MQRNTIFYSDLAKEGLMSQKAQSAQHKLRSMNSKKCRTTCANMLKSMKSMPSKKSNWLKSMKNNLRTKNRNPHHPRSHRASHDQSTMNFDECATLACQCLCAPAFENTLRFTKLLFTLFSITASDLSQLRVRGTCR